MKINFSYPKRNIAYIVLTCLFSAIAPILGSSKDEEDNDNFLDSYINEEVRKDYRNSGKESNINKDIKINNLGSYDHKAYKGFSCESILKKKVRVPVVLVAIFLIVFCGIGILSMKKEAATREIEDLLIQKKDIMREIEDLLIQKKDIMREIEDLLIQKKDKKQKINILNKLINSPICHCLPSDKFINDFCKENEKEAWNDLKNENLTVSSSKNTT